MRSDRYPNCGLLRMLSLIACLLAVPAHAATLDAYGELPALGEVKISPDGTRLALVRTVGETRSITVVTIADGKPVAALKLGTTRVRHLAWADEHRLLVTTSQAGTLSGRFGGVGIFDAESAEHFLLQVYDITANQVSPVPNQRHPAARTLLNVVVGEVSVRRIDAHTVLFVPVLEATSFVSRALLRVDLDAGEERLVQFGERATERWLVDAAGEVVARQDYDQDSQRWALLARSTTGMKVIASGRAAIDEPELVGFGPTPDQLLVGWNEGGQRSWKLLSMADGHLAAASALLTDSEEPMLDPLTGRPAVAVASSDFPHYRFLEPRRQAGWDATLHAFGGDRVRFESASRDFGKLVVRVEGSQFGLKYQLVDLATGQADPIGKVYSGIETPLPVRRIDYSAADGLRIPAYLTLPRDVAPKALPLVVMPHGGPAARSTAEFNWWPQALADQGYAVLEPNFRGSTTSGALLRAGYGEFGRKMQSDLVDGVAYLAAQGWIDPGRVCIVGASYGGYAALAGASLQPGTFRCAVSVAGLSDLAGYLRWIDEHHQGMANLSERYWDRFIGVSGPDDKALDDLSPILHVASVNAPILLIHGNHDTVVPIGQSRRMFEALRGAGKVADLVELDGEDHWLSLGTTRLRMLQETVAFLKRYNPVAKPAQGLVAP